jgi:hypothetical protein
VACACDLNKSCWIQVWRLRREYFVFPYGFLMDLIFFGGGITFWRVAHAAFHSVGLVRRDRVTMPRARNRTYTPHIESSPTTTNQHRPTSQYVSLLPALGPAYGV